MNQPNNKSWKKELVPLYIERLKLLNFRAEKWIPKIVRESMLEWCEDSYNLKNVGYVWFNLISSEFYFGETSNVFRVRMSQHFRDYNNNEKRRQYRRMRIIGFEQWIPVPLRVFYNSTNRKRWERKIIERYHNQVINDKSTFSSNDTINNANDMSRKLIYKAINEDWSNYNINLTWHIINLENRYRLPRLLYIKFNEKAIERLNDDKYKERYIIKTTNDIKSTHQIKYMFKSILRRELNENDYNFIMRRLMITKISNKTILDKIRMNHQIHKRVSEEDYKICNCENDDRYNKIDNHINMKTININNNEINNKYLKINIKTPLKSSDDEYRDIINGGIYLICKLFEVKSNTKLELMKISHKIIKNDLIDATNMKEEMNILTNNRELSIYELDKNIYSTNLICSKKYKEDLIGAFDDNNNRQYKRVDIDIDEILKMQKDNYNKLKISKRVNIIKNYQISAAKIIYKNKDINRTRNMVSFYNFIGKNAGKIIGRAMNVIIKLIKKLITNYDIATPDDFKRIMNSINYNYLKNMKEKKKITIIKMDVKNQYTSLDQKEGLISLKRILRIYKREHGDVIKIARKKFNKIKDSPGVGSLKEYRNITIEEIIEYCEYELENNYIKVGNLFVVKQVDGFPIGGIVSSQLAIIDSIRREYEAQSKINRYFGQMKKYIFRYRDDILCIIFKKLNDNKINNILKLVNKMYDPTNYPNNKVEVGLEDVSNGIMCFLDFKIIFKDNFFIITDNNSNISIDYSLKDKKLKLIRREKNLWKRRYPSIESNFEPKVYYNTIVNVFEKTKKRNNNGLYYLLSQLCNIFEFMDLLYPSKLIIRSLFNVDRFMAKLTMRMIRGRGGLCC